MLGFAAGNWEQVAHASERTVRKRRACFMEDVSESEELRALNAALAPTLRGKCRAGLQPSRHPFIISVSVPPASSPTPRQIFRMFDRGEITREQFRAMMNVHAQVLIEEMTEVHENWLAAWMESLRNRRIARRLARDYGEPLLREIFVALSEVPDFPLAGWLWNADHPHLPLDCFLRTRREPLFKILRVSTAPFSVAVSVEFGGSRKSDTVRERFSFERDRFGRLDLVRREPL